MAADKDMAEFLKKSQKVSNSPKLSANWIMGELSAELNNENLGIKESKFLQVNLANSSVE